MSAHRAGVVALLGRPNAGKSTLLNHLLGEKLAIVTRKPQTTRSRILGILTRPDAQLLLLDTPGFHESGKALNQALNELALEGASDCDVALLLVDPRTEWDAEHDEMVGRLRRRGAALLVVETKSDLERPRRDDAPIDLRISARTGEGVDALLDRVVAELPESPPYYGEDELTDRPMRFLAAEIVRESIFEVLSQELPYETAVEVLRFDESDPELLRIDANLLVERKSQKGMLVGKGGATVREIGSRARRALESWLERRVHLALWVKVEAKWSKRPNRLKSLGYH